MDLPTRNLGSYIKEKGFNLSEISRKTGIPYRTLYDSLANKGVDRSLRAGEYLVVCKHLEVDPMTFYPEEQKEAG